jgi:hypothetical protein
VGHRTTRTRKPIIRLPNPPRASVSPRTGESNTLQSPKSRNRQRHDSDKDRDIKGQGHGQEGGGTTRHRRTPRGVGRQSLFFDAWRLDVIGVSQAQLSPLPRARKSSNRVTGNWWVRMDGLVAHRLHSPGPTAGTHCTVMKTLQPTLSSIGVRATPPSTTVQLVFSSVTVSKHFTRAITAQEQLRTIDSLVLSLSLFLSCQRLGPVGRRDQMKKAIRDITSSSSSSHDPVSYSHIKKNKNNTVQTVTEPRGTVLRASCDSLGARGGEEERTFLLLRNKKAGQHVVR